MDLAGTMSYYYETKPGPTHPSVAQLRAAFHGLARLEASFKKKK